MSDQVLKAKKVGKYFDKASSDFDTFYDKQRGPLLRWIDRHFRSDIYIRYKLTFEALEPLKDKTILDVGCGSGPYSVEAAKRGAQKVVGLDMADGMLEIARKRAKSLAVNNKCDFIKGKFPEKIPDEDFDYTIVMGVMDYIEDQETFLKVLCQKTKKRSALSFPSKHWLRTPFRKLRYYVKRCPLYFYDEELINKLMSKTGFSNIHIYKIPGSGMDYFVNAEAD